MELILLKNEAVKLFGFKNIVTGDKELMTFDDLKDAVIGETILIDKKGDERYFYGFTHKNELITVRVDDGGTASWDEDIIKHWHIKGLKSELFYKWRLWLSNGDICEPSYYINECGISGDVKPSTMWKNAIKREKISEGVAKVEGQE